MKVDGRRVDRAELEAIRIAAVQRVRNGERPADVIASYGLHRTVIYRWLAAERKAGVEALRARKATGRPPKLGTDERSQLRGWLTDSMPSDWGLEGELWTRRTVGELSAARFGVTVGPSAVDRILASLGIHDEPTRASEPPSGRRDRFVVRAHHVETDLVLTAVGASARAFAIFSRSVADPWSLFLERLVRSRRGRPTTVVLDQRMTPAVRAMAETLGLEIEYGLIRGEGSFV
jgi:transposase